MGNVTNADRADWAHGALMYFAEEVGLVRSGDSEDLELVIRDFLCDLMHLCNDNEVNISQVIEDARCNYEEEKVEEDESDEDEL